MACSCFIIPQDVLTRFASDRELSEEIRRIFNATANVSKEIRALRNAHIETLLFLFLLKTFAL